MRAGLYAREDDVSRDALTGLEQTLPKPVRTAGKKAKRTKAVMQKPNKPLTEVEFDQHVLNIRLITRLVHSLGGAVHTLKNLRATPR